jgi:iron complex transport system ATP-binding protein
VADFETAPNAADPGVIAMRAVALVRAGQTILEGIDWRVLPGEDWAILGPNGAGKSSLLSLVMAYAWPTRGEVEVLGARLGRVRVADLRRRIGYVSAAVADRLQAFPGERAIDVVLGGRDASIAVRRETTAAERDAAHAHLAAAGMGALAMRAFVSLSQGERQRVLIARAFMAAPELMILDEAATGLDLGGREGLVSALEALARRRPRPTLLYVSHHPEEVPAFVGHALLLAGGRIVAQGDKHAVLADGPLTRAFGLPLRVAWHEGRVWVRTSPAQAPDQVDAPASAAQASVPSDGRMAAGRRPATQG